MTSREFIQKITKIKQEWRRGMITDTEYHSAIQSLRTKYYRAHSAI